MRRRPWAAWILSAALASGATAAHAQGAPLAPEVDAQRRLLIEQAQSARTAGDHARALELATRASAIRATPSLRQLIAAEQAALGRNADALESAALCESAAIDDARTPERDAQIAACRELVASLQPRVGSVQVRAPDPAPDGLSVELAGRALPRELWSVARPVDPGDVAVTASAPGYAALRRVVHVDAGQTVEVPLSLERAPVATVPAQPGPHPALLVAPTVTARGPSLAGPFAVMGVGAASLAASAVFYGLRGANLTGCTPDTALCDSPQHADAANGPAQTFNLATNVALIGGAAVLGAGTVWLVVALATAPHAREARAAARVAPRLAGLAVEF